MYIKAVPFNEKALCVLLNHEWCHLHFAIRNLVRNSYLKELAMRLRLNTWLPLSRINPRTLTPKQQYTVETNMTAVRMTRPVVKKPIIRLELQTGRMSFYTCIYYAFYVVVFQRDDSRWHDDDLDEADEEEDEGGAGNVRPEPGVHLFGVLRREQEGRRGGGF